MLTEQEIEQLAQLCSINPDYAHLIDRIQEENQLMLSSITHEIRNPLTLIYSTLQLMEARNPELTTIKYWEQLLPDVKNLSALLNDLTTYNHSCVLNLEPLNLYDLLTEIKTSFEATAQQNNVSFELEIADYLTRESTQLICDHVKLKQVFVNIIKNAFEAVPKHGNVKIEVHTTMDSSILNSNITLYEIKISNSGSRISPDKLASIFEPFITTKPDGNGLGLAIAKRVITAHHGVIKAFSNDTETSFTIYLPKDITHANESCVGWY